MSSFTKYFKEHFFNTWIRIPFFTVLSLIVLTLQCSGTLNNENREFFTKGNIELFSLFIMVLCTVIPIFEMYQFNDKRNMDTLRALPLNKNKLLAAHFLNGFSQIFICITVIFLWWLLTYASNNAVWLNTKYFLSLYGMLIGTSLTFYSIYSFAFIQANNMLDGIVFMVMWSLTFAILGELYQHIANNLAGGGYLYMDAWYYRIGYWSYLLIPHNFITTALDYFTYALEAITITDGTDKVLTFNDFPETVHFPVAAVCFGAIAVVMISLMFVTFSKKKVYKIGDCSDSWLGYRLLLPLIALYPFFGYGRSDWTVFTLMVASIPGLSYYFTPLVLFGGYALMRRGIRFKVSDIVVMSVSILPYAYYLIRILVGLYN